MTSNNKPATSLLRLGGAYVPMHIIEWALEMEGKGWRFQPNGPKLRVFNVQPECNQLQPSEADFIKTFKIHILSIVSFEPDVTHLVR